MLARPLRSLILVAAVAAVLAPAAAAQEKTTLQAQFAKQGALVEGGLAVDVRVTVRCPAGYRVLEAFAYVTQDGNQSQFAPIPVVCDGKRHTYTVRVRGFEPFHRGTARASGYILVENPETGATQSVSPTAEIKLR